MRARRWWHFWKQNRRPVRADAAALAKMEDSLSLEEIMHFRMNAATRHSKPLRNWEFREVIMPLLDALCFNITTALPANVEAVLLGRPVRCRPPLAVILLTSCVILLTSRIILVTLLLTSRNVLLT